MKTPQNNQAVTAYADPRAVTRLLGVLKCEPLLRPVETDENRAP